jgi:hypothetical protein
MQGGVRGQIGIYNLIPFFLLDSVDDFIDEFGNRQVVSNQVTEQTLEFYISLKKI